VSDLKNIRNIILAKACFSSWYNFPALLYPL
jgi:hypothetical protein